MSGQVRPMSMSDVAVGWENRAKAAEVDAEALAEALKGLLHYAGREIPAHHVAKAELALARHRGEKPSSIRTLVEGRDE